MKSISWHVRMVAVLALGIPGLVGCPSPVEVEGGSIIIENQLDIYDWSTGPLAIEVRIDSTSHGTVAFGKTSTCTVATNGTHDLVAVAAQGQGVLWGASASVTLRGGGSIGVLVDESGISQR